LDDLKLNPQKITTRINYYRACWDYKPFDVKEYQKIGALIRVWD